MQTTPLHMLGALLGIENYTPPGESAAHFSLERDAHIYTLDAQLTDKALVLCLSRSLLAYEEQDKVLLEAAARIAYEHAPIEAFHSDGHMCFVARIAYDGVGSGGVGYVDRHVLEQRLELCLACHDALRGM